MPLVASETSTAANASPSAPRDVTLNSPFTVYCFPSTKPLTLAPQLNAPALPFVAVIFSTPPLTEAKLESWSPPDILNKVKRVLTPRFF